MKWAEDECWHPCTLIRSVCSLRTSINGLPTKCHPKCSSPSQDLTPISHLHFPSTTMPSTPLSNAFFVRLQPYGYWRIAADLEGNAKYGDHLERAFHNGAPGAVNRSFLGHVYFQSANLVPADQNSSSARDRWDEGFYHMPPCCTGNQVSITWPPSTPPHPYLPPRQCPFVLAHAHVVRLLHDDGYWPFTGASRPISRH